MPEILKSDELRTPIQELLDMDEWNGFGYLKEPVREEYEALKAINGALRKELRNLLTGEANRRRETIDLIATIFDKSGEELTARLIRALPSDGVRLEEEVSELADAESAGERMIRTAGI